MGIGWDDCLTCLNTEFGVQRSVERLDFVAEPPSVTLSPKDPRRSRRDCATISSPLAASASSKAA
jgi:hypothetical protein